ncbi:uncharacterized protein B0P05DRAFT_556103 [Gilbertella persicaria]|uniref:uncharacterized protein n=1 Tax=Gilbertella persicaria TaxID=101096 RepID=UPI00221F3336|nr:uncharacterized protein B0P05DRAFT_556103 [Gilbertella persicaria]KAI8062794.1 hypothetical protein B0P05DRAFT_556103 [Gilbertella persicaria]
MYSRHLPNIQSIKASINTTRFKRFLRISIPSRSRNLWYRLLYNKISSRTITTSILQLLDDNQVILDEAVKTIRKLSAYKYL